MVATALGLLSTALGLLATAAASNNLLVPGIPGRGS